MTSTECPITDAYNPMCGPDVADPFPFYESARQHCPVVYHPAFDAYLVTRDATIRAVLDDPQRYSSRGSVPSADDDHPAEVAAVLERAHPMSASVVTSDPPDHQWRKAIWQRAFHGPRINQFRPQMQDIASRLLPNPAEAGRMDLVTDYAQPYVQGVVGSLLAVPEQDRAVAYARAMDYLALANPLLTMDDRVAAAERHVAFDTYLLDLIHQRRRRPGEDLLSTLILTDDLPGTPLDDSDLLMMIRTMYGAGIDTTRDTLSGTAWELLANNLWHTAAAEPSLIPRAVEERNRRAGAHRNLLRTTTCQVELEGVTLPQGARVLVMFPAAGRDPERFAHPDEFDLDRPNVREHLAFGRGRHLCVGAHLARTEIQVGLEVITQHLPEARCAITASALTYRPDLFFYGLEALPLSWG